MKRFVLHKHSGYGPTHWDLMLETHAALATWSLSADPLAGPPLEATQIHDHRKAYLDYSGPVSGERGRVAPQDSGALTVTSCEENLWAFELRGGVLIGRFELRRVAGDRWMFQAG